MGVPGVTKPCIEAVATLLQLWPRPDSARIITAYEGKKADHALILRRPPADDPIVISSGFGSGYVGEGSRGFSLVLALIDSMDVPIDEVEVPLELMSRLELSGMTEEDLEVVTNAPRITNRWTDYIYELHWRWQEEGKLWSQVDPILPLGIIDSKVIDLALRFCEDSDETLMKAARRLDHTIRDLTGISAEENLSQAFFGKNRVIKWEGISDSEQRARAQLFVSSFGAFRNPRMHREEEYVDLASHVSEFLTLNSLFRLLRQAIIQEPD